jgi:hypothetical protein
MKVKTNIRAGKGGADDTAPEDVSGQNQNQKQKGKTTNTVVYYYPPVSRCVGI